MIRRPPRSTRTDNTLSLHDALPISCDPGASDVLTHGFGFIPRSFAFLATSPAAPITPGFEALVQLVIAAITTSTSPLQFSLHATAKRCARSVARRLGTESVSRCRSRWYPTHHT